MCAVGQPQSVRPARAAEEQQHQLDPKASILARVTSVRSHILAWVTSMRSHMLASGH